LPEQLTAELEDRIIQHLSSICGNRAEDIDRKQSFHRNGLTSLGAARLLARLSEDLGRPLPPTLVWERPTVASLARFLSHSDDGARIMSSQVQPVEAREPIAIVGLACRFPKAADPNAYWRLLIEGVDAITEVPPERWDIGALYDLDASAPGRMNTKWGGFLDSVDGFESQFFGISPREAAEMDPQQRLALELAWEAIEDAGLCPPALFRSRTGVFLGALFTDYALLHDRAGAKGISAYTSTGRTACIIANRISYALGLMGPSITVDTASSSSLVAVHLAAQSLRAGESDLALAGGVNILVVPETTMCLTKLGVMSPDGHCRAFDAGANGYVRSEGAGILALKRLRDSLRDGDQIYAVIRGSAVNNDGASNGLTAPNPAAQEAALREACAHSGLSPADVHYVEAHGTGSKIGDPIEAAQIGAVYGAAHAYGDPILIGSAKTNVGHLEAAAGVAGLIKVALAMKHDRLPASLHFKTPNPIIDFKSLNVRVVDQPIAWPGPEGSPRRAGISSFGYGGTNCHVILESILPRATIPAHNGVAQHSEPTVSRGVVWVFSGQGSQWPGMGRTLILSEPVFREEIKRCDRALTPWTGFSVFDALYNGASGAVSDRIDIVWPVLFAFQVGLAGLLSHIGLRPAAVIGHSIGEVAAAHIAGALNLEDAARLIASQAKLVQRTVGQGRMLLAAIGWDEAQHIASRSGGNITAAIAASPAASVLSGEPSALAQVQDMLTKRGTFVRAVSTGVAVHGPQMALVESELPSLIAPLRPQRSAIPIVSGLTGALFKGEDLDSNYWARQLRQPVLFAQGAAALLDLDFRLFIEVSPHPIVKQSLEESLRARQIDGTVVGALFRGEDEGRTITEAVATLVANRADLACDEHGPIHERQHWPFLLSAKSEASLRGQASRLRDCVRAHADVSLGDLAFSLATTRTHFEQRAVVVAKDRQELLETLEAVAEGGAAPKALFGRAATDGKVVFVFPGQGSQWEGMALALLESSAIFRAEMEACERALAPHVDWSLMAVLRGEGEATLDRVDVVQPVLFAVMVSMAALWRSMGIEPVAVIGHSQGEIAAAYVAGMLSLNDAAKIVAVRSRVLRRLAGKGAMAAVELGVAELQLRLARWGDRLSVAAVNSPKSTLVSGDPEAIDALLEGLEKAEIFARKIRVDYASHCAAVDEVCTELLDELGTVTPAEGSLSLYSTVTGDQIDGVALDAGYWHRNLRQTVRFAEAVQKLGADYGFFVEVSPHPVLSIALKETFESAKRDATVVGTLRRDDGDWDRFLLSVGEFHARGGAIDWGSFFAPFGLKRVTLPTYAFQRERFWLEVPEWNDANVGRGLRGEHPLLGMSFRSSLHPDEHIFEQWINTKDLRYLADHKVQGEVVFPGAGYVEMALAAAAKVLSSGPIVLEDVRLDAMLPLSHDGGGLVQTSLVAQAGAARFSIASGSSGSGPWLGHARGRIIRLTDPAPSLEQPCVSVAARNGKSIDSASHYASMEARDLQYGPAFRSVNQIWPQEGSAIARIRLPDAAGQDTGPYHLHPSLLDAGLQTALGLVAPETAKGTLMPVSARRVTWYRRSPSEGWVHAQANPKVPLEFNVTLTADGGEAIAEIQGLRLSPVAAQRQETEDPSVGATFAIEWRRSEAPTAVSVAEGRRVWLIVADAGGTALALADQLRARGEPCVLVEPDQDFARLDDGHWRLDPANSEHLDRVFGRFRECRGVVHCGALDDAALPADGETLEAGIARGTLVALKLVQAVLRQAFRDTPRLVIVTRGAQRTGLEQTDVSVTQSPLWGLGPVIALEHPDLECTLIDLPRTARAAEIEELALEILAPDGEQQIAWRQDGRLVARLVPVSIDSVPADPPPSRAAGRPFRLETREPGILEHLMLREIDRPAPGPGEVEIEVEAAGLNFVDVMKAMGVDPGIQLGPVKLGIECSGTITAVGEGVTHLAVGTKLLAWANGGFSTHVLVPATHVAVKPQNMTFEEAAALPAVFTTALWSLGRLARLSRGERILIHSASGGTGLAALQYARAVNAEIFATAGNEERRAFLRSLGAHHVMDSRSLAFADEIMAKTGGRGVDVVLNSLVGDALKRSLEVVAPYGRFIEIGKKDIYSDAAIGLYVFRRCISFSSVDLAGMAVEEPARFEKLLREVMDRFEDGTFTPLPVTTYPASRAQQAFRHMSGAKHIGKVVISMKDPDACVLPRIPGPTKIVADVTYLITGGLGGLGLDLALWLVSQGARHLALAGRSAPSEAARSTIAGMESEGAIIRILQGDVARPEDVCRMMEEIRDHLPPLRGVVHAAGVLNDRTLAEMTDSEFWSTIRPKALGAWNLHLATRTISLDFFVMYSSVAALLGSPGQGNYAAGNAFLNALAQTRAAEGLPATCIQWGRFSDVGLAAGKENRGQRLSQQGIESWTPAQGVGLLARILKKPRTEIGLFRFSLRRWLESHPQAAGMRFLAELSKIDAPVVGASDGGMRKALALAEAGIREAMVEAHLVDQIARVIRMDPARVDRNAPFKSLGFDSLMSVELRNRLENSLGLKLSTVLLFTYPTAAKLAAYLTSMLVPDEELPAKVEPATPAPSEDAMKNLGADELLAMLGEELARSRTGAL
jgi:acyl transferase domain-containing protein/acyl carrier protein